MKTCQTHESTPDALDVPGDIAKAIVQARALCAAQERAFAREDEGERSCCVSQSDPIGGGDAPVTGSVRAPALTP